MEPIRFTKRRYTLAGVSVAAVVLIQVVLSACQQTVQSARSVPPSETQPQILPTSPTPVASASPAAAEKGEKTVAAYRVVHASEGAHLEKVDVPAGSGDEPAVSALNAMARMKDSPLPKGTKALSVTFADDLATVNFNKAFSSHFEGGDEREALMFNAITATLGQFPNIKRVQILVDGQKVAVGGTQDTTEPLDVPPSVTQVSQRTGGLGESGDR